jgi:hypothetical protein
VKPKDSIMNVSILVYKFQYDFQGPKPMVDVREFPSEPEERFLPDEVHTTDCCEWSSVVCELRCPRAGT